MMMDRLKLSAPWETLRHEMEQLFGSDPDIKIAFDEQSYELKLYVDGERKAAALTKLLAKEKTYGNVTVKIEVIPANTTDETIAELYKDAFDGNEVVDEVLTVKLPGGGAANYVIFKNEVVQFFNDDISDPQGLESTLYENIADDVFERQGGEFYTTGTRYSSHYSSKGTRYCPS